MSTSRRQFLFFCFGLSTTSAFAARPLWIHVRQQQADVRVIQAGRTLLQLDHAAFARRGVGQKRQRGDDITPAGDFKIRWLNANSRFRYFIGLDYPNLDYASRALQEDRIDNDTFRDIAIALHQGKRPPQNTILGGYIGIHGLGGSDPAIHAQYHWTKGCVAVRNPQIDVLRPFAHIGTQVVIEASDSGK